MFPHFSNSFRRLENEKFFRRLFPKYSAANPFIYHARSSRNVERLVYDLEPLVLIYFLNTFETELTCDFQAFSFRICAGNTPSQTRWRGCALRESLAPRNNPLSASSGRSRSKSFRPRKSFVSIKRFT